MKKLHPLLVACLLFVLPAVSQKTFVDNQYIVVFKQEFKRSLPQLPTKGNNPKDRKASAEKERNALKDKIAEKLAGKLGRSGKVKKVFTDGDIAAVIEVSDPGQLGKLALDNDVLRIEKDLRIQAIDMQFSSFSSKPIMQMEQWKQTSLASKPIMQYFSKPIMQEEIKGNPALLLDKKTNVSAAIARVKGPVDRINSSRRIWFLDTGIDPDTKLLNVETDPVLAVSFIEAEPSFVDGNGHGTHCASLAAGIKTDFGIGGVVPGALVVPVKVLDSQGEGTWSSILSGLDHVASMALPGDVVNMSFGASDPSFNAETMPPLTEAIQKLSQMGVYVVMSAGNEDEPAANNLPGLINGEKVFTIGSTTSTGTILQFSVYSNFNTSGASAPIDFVIPGEQVLGLWKDGQYRILSGTSMAAAIFSGLMYASNGEPGKVDPLARSGESEMLIRDEHQSVYKTAEVKKE